MKNLKVLLVFGSFLFCFSACYTHTHVVGEGAESGVTVEKKQWYALWGLVPINEVDTKEMSDGKENYTIKTEHSFIDQVIGFFTGIVTIFPKTVSVQK